MRYRKHAFHPLTCWAGIAALLASITLSFPASAATYTVTNLNDSGAGSLRQAILDANATLGVADTIEFDPSVTGTITLTTGEIQITDKLTLNGPGEAVLTISGNQKSRIFNVKTMNTTMSSLTLKDGKVSSDGGAILNQGSLTLKQLTFTNNKADGYSSGGAIKNDGVLTMSDIIVTGSSATHDGGAFYNNGLATLNNGTFSGNLTTNGGGAILNTSSGKLTINRAVFDGNQSDYGGAINNSGILSLNESAFSANQAKNAGGAICSNGRLSVTNSLFAQNRSGTNGGGIATQEDTTIYNSTFSQNYAESSGGAICAYRYGYSPSLTLLNDTLTGNYAGAGGSVWFGGTLTIGNTISVGNFAPTNLEIYKSSGTFTSQGNNLFGSNTIFGGSDAASSGYSDLTIQSTDSILTEEPETVIGSLMDNGGFTQTHALIPGSPAIDAGGNSIVPTELTTDQRGVGFPRIVGDRVDIGAFEAGGVATAYPLTITLVGKGSVSSAPTGVTCSGTTCSGSFPIDAEVTLTAKPLTGFTFGGWSGACTNKTGTCAVTMSKAQTVTATFTAAPVSYSLTLTKVGDGIVTSNPMGIKCGTGTGCAAKFASGKTITLTAVPATGATFVKWTGCTASATDSKKCTLTLTANKTVTATFSTATAATADFIITAITLTPTSPVANGLFNVNITVKNKGTKSADGGTLSVWTNRTSKPECSTGGDKAVPIGSVAAGNTKVLTISELAAGAVGTKKLYAFADSKCVRQEIDETNNQLTKNYTVKQ